MAIYKLGAIALPLALLFGADALEYRLKTASACAVITNDFGLSRLEPIRASLPDLREAISIGTPSPSVLSFETLWQSGSASFEGHRPGQTIRH